MGEVVFAIASEFSVDAAERCADILCGIGCFSASASASALARFNAVQEDAFIWSSDPANKQESSLNKRFYGDIRSK